MNHTLTTLLSALTLSTSTLACLACLGAVSGCAGPAGPDGAEPPGAPPPIVAEGEAASSDGESLGTSSGELSLRPLEVSFAGCDEVVGVAAAPFAKARAMVPSGFALASDGTVAPFVVRVGRCNAVRVGGAPPEAGTVAQLGVSVVPPDGTGDINIYTNWYYTTSLRLAVGLNLLGVPAQWAPQLDYELEGGTLDVDLGFPAQPRFALTSAVVEPGPVAIPSTVNWWRQSGSKITKMSTVVPNAFLGAATTTLTAPPGGALASLFGASTVSFPFLDAFNRFPAATMTVSKD